jgi:cysteinyl-tRNA synthetase
MSDLRIFNTKTKSDDVFKSLTANVVKMYVCGPTVQSSPHIGHMRAATSFDVIRRYFEASGYKVQFVQNVTDVNDSIFSKSLEQGTNWRDHAKKYEAEFFDAYSELNVLMPSDRPHATEYIKQQIELVQRIIDNGYAYQGAPGDVWFDTTAWKDYGELTNQTDSDELEVSEEDFRTDKRNPRDFALWKAPKSTDPADGSWDSPWGRGCPGWHLECSAMSTDLLGPEFDIHGGGLDLRFPHHENEVAQARAAGMGFAKLWMHSAWVTSKGEKMSKSLGNGLGAYEVIKADPLNALALRFALSSVHYRSMIEWVPDELEDDPDAPPGTLGTLRSSKTAVLRLYNTLVNLAGEKYTDDIVQAVQIDQFVDVFPKFKEQMDNDFNVSGALSEIYAGIESGVPILFLRRALDILGIDLLNSKWRGVLEKASAIESGQASSEVSPELQAEIESLIEERNNAKKNKDFQTADQIRDDLKSRGIELIDTADGTSFKTA